MSTLTSLTAPIAAPLLRAGELQGRGAMRLARIAQCPTQDGAIATACAPIALVRDWAPNWNAAVCPSPQCLCVRVHLQQKAQRSRTSLYESYVSFTSLIIKVGTHTHTGSSRTRSTRTKKFSMLTMPCTALPAPRLHAAFADTDVPPKPAIGEQQAQAPCLGVHALECYADAPPSIVE